MSIDTLTVRFESADALRGEFEKNIANRGLFVATVDRFEVRQPISVDIVLEYVERGVPALSLDGEVVHIVPPEMESNGATPGVAIQFEASAGSLRERFEPLLGADAPELEPDKDLEGPARRSAKRGAVRVPVRVMPTTSPPFEATSRDLSTSGILISMKADALPVGEVVRICLWHPSGDPSCELDGKVVRQVPNKKGRIAAVAVAFDRSQAAEPIASRVIDALREAGHRSRLGGISGSLADLGLANMLQMFGASAPQGTIVVERDVEQGWVAFAEGQLLGAELGPKKGQDALVAMLAWGEGQFQFEATVDPKLESEATPAPLAGAVMQAVCALDELNHENGEDGDLDELDSCDEGGGHGMPIEKSTTFEIDEEQVDLSRSTLDKTADAILELARSGMSVERLCGVIPEPTEQVEAAVESLVEMGLLVPRLSAGDGF